MYRQTYAQMAGQTDEGMDKWTDKWTNIYRERWMNHQFGQPAR